jgi:threonine synthase
LPTPWLLVCRRCGLIHTLSEPVWRCRCGGLFDLQGPRADPLPAGGEWSLWRYRSVLPFAGDDAAWKKITLGEGLTPLVRVRPGLSCKLDYVSATGSFKDRGAAVMLAIAAGLGVAHVVVDSSGNAGRAVAAYAARAHMGAQVYVPADTPAAKVAAIAAFGAGVVVVDGDRAAAADAARDAVEAGHAWYASHVYRPEFVHGVKTLAFELYEQLGGPPATVIVPAGNGTLVSGLWLGFRELAAYGHVARPPMIVAVQAEWCAPLAGSSQCGPTAASGIAIARPQRRGEVRAAVVASGGRVVTVAEEALEPARSELAGLGLAVEPTAAAAWAAVGRAGGLPEPVVVVLTGAAWSSP